METAANVIVHCTFALLKTLMETKLQTWHLKVIVTSCGVEH